MVADLRYYHEPSKSQKAPEVVMTQISDRKQEADIFPFVCWSTAPFSFADRGPRTFGIKLVLGLLVESGDSDLQKSTGYEQISELVETLCTGLLVKKHFRPFKISGDVSGRIGDEDGRQPLPQFFATIDLKITAAG